MDDLRRARLERSLLEAETAGAQEPSRGRVWALAAAAVALLAVVGVAWGLLEEPGPVAEFESFRDGVRVRQGEFAAGETLQTVQGQLLRVAIGAAHGDGREALVEVGPGSRVRFDEVTGSDLGLRLFRGSVRVEFHPRVPGEVGFRVATDVAEVRVVGTIFEVVSDPEGTRVGVEQGVVQVLPLSGEPRLVRASEDLVVPADGSLEGETPAREQSAQATGDAEDEDYDMVIAALARARARSYPPEDAVRSVPERRQSVGATADEDVASGEFEQESEAAPESVELAEELDEESEEPEVEVEESEVVAEAPGVSEEETDGPLELPGSGAGGLDAPGDPAPAQSRSAYYELSTRERFDLAQRLFRDRRFAMARHELYVIARNSSQGGERARAWLLVARSWEREGDVEQVVEAYRRAISQGGSSSWAGDALYALAQTRLRGGDVAAGRRLLLRYLEEHPDGTRGAAVRERLCRLGSEAHCEE